MVFRYAGVHDLQWHGIVGRMAWLRTKPESERIGTIAIREWLRLAADTKLISAEERPIEIAVAWRAKDPVGGLVWRSSRLAWTRRHSARVTPHAAEKSAPRAGAIPIDMKPL